RQHRRLGRGGERPLRWFERRRAAKLHQLERYAIGPDPAAARGHLRSRGELFQRLLPVPVDRRHVRLPVLIGLAAAFVFAAAFGCGRSGGCHNGVCGCPQGASCELGCSAPPCHVTCEGDNPSCQAVCANGTCTCGSGSDCSFACHAPPCHVTCESHTTCSGTCANGQCACGEDSHCSFTCLASPCHTSCAAGASCVVHCPTGLAGSGACDIVSCAAAAPIVCPRGDLVTCGAPCP